MINKIYLKTVILKNYYKYQIFEIETNGDSWLVAEPLTRGLVTRTAENERILRILLENDCINHTKFQQKAYQR